MFYRKPLRYISTLPRLCKNEKRTPGEILLLAQSGHSLTSDSRISAYDLQQNLKTESPVSCPPSKIDFPSSIKNRFYVLTWPTCGIHSTFATGQVPMIKPEKPRSNQNSGARRPQD